MSVRLNAEAEIPVEDVVEAEKVNGWDDPPGSVFFVIVTKPLMTTPVTVEVVLDTHLALLLAVIFAAVQRLPPD